MDPELLAAPCHDDWLVGYSRPHSQHLAARALQAAGFETYIPLRKRIIRRPASSISSKTRHKRRHELVEKIEPVFFSYVFLRDLRGTYALADIFRLEGVGGLCRLGEAIASIKDWEVECLRLAEADGRFNVYDLSIPHGQLRGIELDPRLTHSRFSAEPTQPWIGTTPFDPGRMAPLLLQELGRVVALVAA